MNRENYFNGPLQPTHFGGKPIDSSKLSSEPYVNLPKEGDRNWNTNKGYADSRWENMVSYINALFRCDWLDALRFRQNLSWQWSKGAGNTTAMKLDVEATAAAAAVPRRFAETIIMASKTKNGHRYGNGESDSSIGWLAQTKQYWWWSFFSSW